VHEFSHISKIKGELNLPGDKSISHRAVIFSSMARGKSVLTNLSDGADVKSTKNCFRQLGIEIKNEFDKVIINGKGIAGLSKPASALNADNSGTTARLISGLLIHQKFETTLIGDNSLSQRPMKRIITPLSAMGGRIEASDNFTLPLKYFPSNSLAPIDYQLPIASAQLKSAVLISGLHFEKNTTVVENTPSRNHTEFMLGLPIKEESGQKIIAVNSSFLPSPKEYFIPSDISSAAFFIVLTLLSSDGELLIKNITLNTTRTAFIDVLKKMGGDISIVSQKETSGEPYGDIFVKNSRLKNILIDTEIIPNIIDEIPILAVAGAFAEDDFIVSGASELRVKESDRIKTICNNLSSAGFDVEENDDGFKISGNIKNKKLHLKSFGDHRIAMSCAVLSMLNQSGGTVDDFECVEISNPLFLEQLGSIVYG